MIVDEMSQLLPSPAGCPPPNIDGCSSGFLGSLLKADKLADEDKVQQPRQLLDLDQHQ